MAEKGWGQPQSYDQAFSWYYKAAEHGNAGAMDNIGFNFQNGVGVAVDYAKAWSWLNRAAALGSAAAENQLGWASTLEGAMMGTVFHDVPTPPGGSSSPGSR